MEKLKTIAFIVSIIASIIVIYSFVREEMEIWAEKHKVYDDSETPQKSISQLGKETTTGGINPDNIFTTL